MILASDIAKFIYKASEAGAHLVLPMTSILAFKEIIFKTSSELNKGHIITTPYSFAFVIVLFLSLLAVFIAYTI